MFIALIYYVFNSFIPLSHGLVEALPAVNDQGYPSESYFSTSMIYRSRLTGQPVQFTKTDEVCLWLIEVWAEAKKNEGSRGFVRTRPFALTHKAYAEENINAVRFWCRDTRSKINLTRAMQKYGEVISLGPYYLACNSASQVAATWPELLSGSVPRATGTRRTGGCKPKDGSSGDHSVVIQAGGSACINAESSARLTNLRAYLDSNEDEDDDDWDLPNEALAGFLSLAELGTARLVYTDKQPLITLSVDHTRTSMYRACAKQAAGHGNTVLHLVTTM